MVNTLKSLPVDEIKFTVHETIESVASAERVESVFRTGKVMQSDRCNG